MKNVTDDQIDQYLSLFNGDSSKAITAIQSRINRLRSESLNVRPLGKVSEDVIISVNDLSKSYKVGRQKIMALNNVSLTIQKGEFIALTGSSGSGKSTLLQLIGGLDTPTSGTIRVDNTLLAELNDRRLSEFRNKTIGFVFQFFYLQPFLKLARNLEIGGMPLRTKRKIRSARAAELARQVDVNDRLDHFPRELSGGQMQRASIARALLNNPKILLADEPTGNLDSKNSAAVINLFEQIRQEFGTTIVIATHDQTIAQRADRVITLRDGLII